MPGIGMITSLAIMSYMGDCKRFSSAKQAAYYAGLVPRVDISGDTVRYGRIINRGCHSIRRVIVQAAWSLVRCQHGGKVKEFYQRLYLKKGAKKSIIATSRKMIEVLYVMIRTGKLFDSMPENILNTKISSIWSYVKKITGGLDTRNIGESVLLSFLNSMLLLYRSQPNNRFRIGF
ncbi:transposase, IS116/IS110/IS902 family [Leptospira interrogans serovar Pyrogenes str. 2006006960]|nr:transposase, IS116/IS110/IS902 family [Leptospira interrogans serovar Pyrogenes str. 2006006960]